MIKEERIFLEHILESIELIERYLHSVRRQSTFPMRCEKEILPLTGGGLLECETN